MVRRCAPAAQGGESRSAAAGQAIARHRPGIDGRGRVDREEGRPRDPAAGGAVGRSRTTTPSRPVSSRRRVAAAGECVGIIRHENNRGVSVHAAPSSVSIFCAAPAGLSTSRGVEQRPELLVAIAGMSDGLAIDSKRHVVEEQAAVDLGDVDPPLEPIRERGERTDDVMPHDADVEREVVAGRRNADERQAVGEGDRRDVAATRRRRPSPERRRRAPRRSRRARIALGERISGSMPSARRARRAKRVPPRRCERG